MTTGSRSRGPPRDVVKRFPEIGRFCDGCRLLAQMTDDGAGPLQDEKTWPVMRPAEYALQRRLGGTGLLPACMAAYESWQGGAKPPPRAKEGRSDPEESRTGISKRSRIQPLQRYRGAKNAKMPKRRGEKKKAGQCCRERRRLCHADVCVIRVTRVQADAAFHPSNEALPSLS